MGRQIALPRHPEQRNQRALTFPKNHRPSTYDRQRRNGGRFLQPSAVALGKDTRKQTSRCKAFPRDAGVIMNVAVHLEAARSSLRVLALDAAASREIRRDAKDEIELLVRHKRVGRTQIDEANLVPIFETVIGGRLSG